MSDDNTCPHCGHEQPMTVRDLIHYLVENTDDLDGVVNIAVESGGNMVAFLPYGVSSLDPEDDDSPRVVIYAETVSAWNTETNEELPAGVLVLEEPADA